MEYRPITIADRLSSETNGGSAITHLLFIDDDKVLLEVTKEYLESVLSMKVDTACDLHQAGEYLSARDYDAVLCDYDLNGSNGIDLLRRLRAGGSYVPFILFTGKGGEQVAAEALNSGADLYLRKGRELSTTFSQLTTRLPAVIQRRQEEESIKQSERRLRYLMDNMGEVLLQVGRGGVVEYASPSANRVFGYTPGEIVGLHVQDFAAQEDIREMSRMLGDPSCQDGSCHLIRTRHKDGSNVWFEASGTMLHDSDGIASGALMVGRDVSARQEALENLKGSEDIFRYLTEAIPDVVISTDLEAKVLYANEALATMLRTPLEDLIGKDLWSVLPSGSKERLELSGEAHETEGGRTTRREIKLPINGSERVYDFTITPVQRDGKRVGTLHIARDVTMRRREEEELRLANNKLSMMQALTRHDLLNQVSALSGYLDLCEKHTMEPSTRDYLAKSRKAVENMTQQLAFAREYQMLGIHEPEWQSLEAIMKRAAEAFDLKDIHLQVEVGGMAVLADPLLEKVFYNLVENSLRHGGKIHEISLTIERQGGELRIVYKDDGKGIPQKDKERIFRRGHGNHTGFGLYAAREVLSLTGMSIIENGLEGHGARFSITVPDRFNRSG